MTRRNGDKRDHTHFRSDRITCENGFFYFVTREGTLEGPYRSRQQAEVAAAVYIRDHLDPSKCESRQHAPDGHISRLHRHRLDLPTKTELDQIDDFPVLDMDALIAQGDTPEQPG
ncbi:MAG: DUF6316 family protein [Moraxellaceae bacterium]|nr:DUF6316 family protein [Moraxellaceae bacterium]